MSRHNPHQHADAPHGHDHDHDRDDARRHDSEHLAAHEHGHQHPSPARERVHGTPGHAHDPREARDRFGNPEDLANYLKRIEDPERDRWQRPDEVIARLAVRRGAIVADVGGGPGWWALRLARAVGESGHVWAVEVEPRIAEVLRERISASGLRNVAPVLALPDDPLLPPASCDLVLVVNTYHHFPDGPAYLRRLAASLRRGGRIANIDFHKRELPVGPPPDHKVAREDFLRDVKQAGLAVAAEHDLLAYQYFFEIRPR